MKLLERAAVAAWWEIAQSDLRVAEVLYSLEPPVFRHVCFNCQQAGEKALKAVLESCSMVIPRTHNLMTLAELLSTDCVDVLAITPSCAALTLHGVGPRYPGTEGAATAADAAEAIAHAAAVVAWAAVKLESEIVAPK